MPLKPPPSAKTTTTAVLSSLRKIPFPTPLTIGTDICHIPRIHRILISSRQAGAGTRFVRRLMNPEELEANDYAFRGVFERYDSLKRSWEVARGFRKNLGMGWRRGVEGVEKEGRGVVGEGRWGVLFPRGGEREGVGEGNVSREGVVMGVLESVVEWKRVNGEEGLGTPWDVLVESVGKGRDVLGMRADVIDAMRLLSGKDMNGKLEVGEQKSGSGEAEISVEGFENAGVSGKLYGLDNAEDLRGTDEAMNQDGSGGRNFPFQRKDKAASQLSFSRIGESSAKLEHAESKKSTLVPKSNEGREKGQKTSKSPNGIQTDFKVFLAIESELQQQIDQTEVALQKPAIFLAGRFAAKEAIMKAHHSHRLSYHDIMIIPQNPDLHGSRPPVAYVVGNGKAKEVKFSISHDAEYATATAMVYHKGGSNSSVRRVQTAVPVKYFMSGPAPESEPAPEPKQVEHKPAVKIRKEFTGGPGSAVNFLW